MKNTCERVQFLVKLQAIALQLYLNWTLSQVFFKDFDLMINLILCRTAILKNTYFCRVPSMAASEKPCATVWRQKSVFQMHFSFRWMCWKSVKSRIFSVHLYSSRQLRASESRATSLVNIYYKLDFEVEHDESAIGVYLYLRKRVGACWIPSHRNIKTHEAVSRCRQKQPPDGDRCWKKEKRSWTCHPC